MMISRFNELAQWAAGTKVPPPAPKTVSGGDGRGAVSKVAAPPSEQGSPSTATEVSASRDGVVGSLGTAPHDKTSPAGVNATAAGNVGSPESDRDQAQASHDKLKAWQIGFFQKMGELKKSDWKLYYDIMGNEGYEHASQVPDRKTAMRVYERISQAIAERQTTIL